LWLYNSIIVNLAIGLERGMFPFQILKNHFIFFTI
jgi:hypothetical protein